jgi:hypothetical protein
MYLPDFRQLVNYPQNIARRAAKGKKCCVMCGLSCLVVRNRGSKERVLPTMPCDNNGVCAACSATFWQDLDSNLVVKWCWKCRTFQRWLDFGYAGMSKHCVHCRNMGPEYKASRKNPLRMEQSTPSSPAPPKGTGERKITETEATSLVQPDRENTHVHDNHAAMLATSMNRCVPLKDPM